MLSLLTILLVACETEISFSGKETAPVLVINDLACSDSALEVTITASLFFLSEKNEYPKITDATVSLFVNGMYTEDLQHSGEGVYKSTYRPKEEDLIRLEVSAPGYASVNTEDVFPRRVSDLQIDSTITKSETSLLVYQSWVLEGNEYIPFNDTVGVTYTLTHRYSIRFSNPPGKNEYYRLVAKTMTTLASSSGSSYEWNTGYITGFDDIVFGTQSDNGMEGVITESENDAFDLFTDELIDGTTHTITFEYDQTIYVYDNDTSGIYTDSYNQETYQHSIIIDLQAISKDYYLYLKTYNSFMNSDTFLSEPVQIHTNVENGLGIFAARTGQPVRFVLP
jgi:hypothetical protein